MKSRVLLMAVVAGSACSLAVGQDAETVRAKKAAAIKAESKAGSHVTSVEYVQPIAVYVNGVEVPFTVGENTSDAPALVYNNVPTPADPFTFTNGGQAVLDDIQLGAPGPVRITGVRPSFATGATVGFPTTNMGVGVIWYNALDPTAPAGTSVASNPQSDLLEVFVVFGAPAAGWAPNTAYTASQFIFFPNNMTTSASGAVEVLMLDATGGFYNPDFTPVYEGTPVALGSSQNVAWLDLNLDGLYEASEAVEATAPDAANLRIALHAEIADPSSGRCCLPGGSCIVISSTRCTTLGGTFGGNGTTCVGNTCAAAPVLWNNGPLATGATSISGGAAPAGTQWSEAVRQDNCVVNVAGYAANGYAATATRLADNFTIPAGQSWTVQNVTVYAYQTGGSATVSPFNLVTLRIWDGLPGAPGSSIVFGDDTTNRYASSAVSFSGVYRIFNTTSAPANAATNRPVWQFQVPVNATLQAGTYYVDYNVGASNSGAVFVPPVSPMLNGQGVYAIEGADGRQFFGGTLNVWTDFGITPGAAPGSGMTGCFAHRAELPFVVRGTSTGGNACYANCDGSTATPVLNVADFSCFLTKFAQQDAYANCDGSTTIPVLNVADFSCFLTKFAQGCP